MLPKYHINFCRHKKIYVLFMTFFVEERNCYFIQISVFLDMLFLTFNNLHYLLKYNLISELNVGNLKCVNKYFALQNLSR